MKYYTQLSELERVKAYEGKKKGWGPTLIDEFKGLELWRLLPKAKSRRGRPRRKYKKGYQLFSVILQALSRKDL